MAPDSSYILTNATVGISNGWGFEIYCTFPQSTTCSNTSEATSATNSKADKALERLKQWMEYGLRTQERQCRWETNPRLVEELEQCMHWTVHFAPGASIETVRSTFKTYLDAEVVVADDGELEKKTERMCLMLDEAMADALLAARALPEPDYDLVARGVFVQVVDPEFEGEPRALSQAGRGPPPPYPAAGVTWYVGSIKCVPSVLWLLYCYVAYSGWDYAYAAGKSLHEDLWLQ